MTTTTSIHRDEISTARRIFADVAARHGFLTQKDVAELASMGETRLTPVLVRCGGCRFTCPAQDVKHLIDIITADGRDYVRDASFPVSERR